MNETFLHSFSPAFTNLMRLSLIRHATSCRCTDTVRKQDNYQLLQIPRLSFVVFFGY